MQCKFGTIVSGKGENCAGRGPRLLGLHRLLQRPRGTLLHWRKQLSISWPRWESGIVLLYTERRISHSNCGLRLAGLIITPTHICMHDVCALKIPPKIILLVLAKVP